MDIYVFTGIPHIDRNYLLPQGIELAPYYKPCNYGYTYMYLHTPDINRHDYNVERR